MRLPTFFFALAVLFACPLTSTTTTVGRVLAQDVTGDQPSGGESASIDPVATADNAASAPDLTVSADAGGDAELPSSDESVSEPASAAELQMVPVLLLGVGILSVLGMIIGLKLNAFLALIISALIVSLGVGWVEGADAGSRMNAVVQSFGRQPGGLGL